MLTLMNSNIDLSLNTQIPWISQFLYKIALFLLGICTSAIFGPTNFPILNPLTSGWRASFVPSIDF